MPEISVIIPVYKAEAFLGECIDSILSQTFSDFELILVDDGSPDNSGAICEEYAAKDSRVSVIHQENAGQAAARNHALTKAKGNWICFIDSDDIIHPRMVELLYHAVCTSGAGVSMCQYIEGLQVPENFYQEMDETYRLLEINEQTLVELYDQDKYPSWVACTKLVRKELIEAYPFREGRVFEDNEAVCRWVVVAKKLASIEKDLYYYRSHPISTTRSTFSLKKLDYLWALDSITRFYGSIGYKQLQQRFFERYIDAVVISCNALRYAINRPDLVPGVNKDLRSLIRDENLKLTTTQREALMEVIHPEWMKFYWPVAGAVRTVKEKGLAGIIRKLRKQAPKGEE